MFWCRLGLSLTLLGASRGGEHAIILLSFRPCWHELISFAWYLPAVLQIPWTVIVHDYWPLRDWAKDILAKNLFWDWVVIERRRSLLWKRLFNSISLQWITNVLKSCELDVTHDINKMYGLGSEWIVKNGWERENHQSKGQSVHRWTEIRIQHKVTEL